VYANVKCRELPEVTLSPKKNAKRKEEDSAKASIGQKLPFLCVKQCGGASPARAQRYVHGKTKTAKLY